MILVLYEAEHTLVFLVALLDNEILAEALMLCLFCYIRNAETRLLINVWTSAKSWRGIYVSSGLWVDAIRGVRKNVADHKEKLEGSDEYMSKFSSFTLRAHVGYCPLVLLISLSLTFLHVFMCTEAEQKFFVLTRQDSEIEGNCNPTVASQLFWYNNHYDGFFSEIFLEIHFEILDNVHAVILPQLLFHVCLKSRPSLTCPNSSH